ncbi:MAG: hypothetical protein Q4A32_06685 [Lachnospiraceae bacterium]|nr:hypothetical protein [Lachnospiraceae bacterium]
MKRIEFSINILYNRNTKANRSSGGRHAKTKKDALPKDANIYAAKYGL